MPLYESLQEKICQEFLLILLSLQGTTYSKFAGHQGLLHSSAIGTASRHGRAAGCRDNSTLERQVSVAERPTGQPSRVVCSSSTRTQSPSHAYHLH